MFRPSRSSSGPPRRQIEELFSFTALWEPKCLPVFVTGTYSTLAYGKELIVHKLMAQEHIVHKLMVRNI